MRELGERAQLLVQVASLYLENAHVLAFSSLEVPYGHGGYYEQGLTQTADGQKARTHALQCFEVAR